MNSISHPRGNFAMRYGTWLVAWLLTGGLCPLAQALGPENVFLVINPRQPDSLTVANHYVALRNLPPSHLFYLPFESQDLTTTVESFRKLILQPIFAEMERRGLSEQIDAIVYSSGYPTTIDLTADVPENIRGKLPSPPFGSLTGMTYLAKATLSKNAGQYLSLRSNQYMRQVSNGVQTQPTQSFRSWYGWSEQGTLLESGGERYILSMLLAVNHDPGNRVLESVLDLQLSAKADGTHPKGTIYYSDTGDVRTKTRQPGFAAAAKELRALGIAAETIAEQFPSGRQDIAGAMLGFADRNHVSENVRLIPGAIIDNLTSYGGVFSGGHGQPLLSQFLRLGAAGAAGTVVEPLAIPNKFAHPFLFVHYARGCTLAEAYYQSIHGPFQNLLVGDPLCAPWARIPTIEVPELSAEKLIQRGKITLAPTATVARGKVEVFEIFLDGRRIARCVAGDSFTLDSTQYADGWHELRVVGTLLGEIESSGRFTQFLCFANTEHELAFAITPQRSAGNQALKITAECATATGLVLYCNGRIITHQPGNKLDTSLVPAQMLNGSGIGSGPTTWRVLALGNAGAASHRLSQPITIQVQ